MAGLTSSTWDQMAAPIGKLLRAVAERFGVSIAEIKSARRTRAVVPARHVAAYLSHTALGMTHQEIGQRLGKRDYTIIAMYCRAVSRRVEEDQEFGRLVQELTTRLES